MVNFWVMAWKLNCFTTMKWYQSFKNMRICPVYRYRETKWLPNIQLHHFMAINKPLNNLNPLHNQSCTKTLREFLSFFLNFSDKYLVCSTLKYGISKLTCTSCLFLKMQWLFDYQTVPLIWLLGSISCIDGAVKVHFCFNLTGKLTLTVHRGQIFSWYEFGGRLSWGWDHS